MACKFKLKGHERRTNHSSQRMRVNCSHITEDRPFQLWRNMGAHYSGNPVERVHLAEFFADGLGRRYLFRDPADHPKVFRNVARIMRAFTSNTCLMKAKGVEGLRKVSHSARQRHRRPQFPISA